MELVLVRTESTADGVFGQLVVGHSQLCTMEDDWNNNLPGESCIPDGHYPLRRTMYYHGGYETFEICDVPGRSRILIHRANTEEDVKGCVGVGMRRGTLWVHDEDSPDHPYVEKQAIIASKQAFELFMKEMQHVDEAVLTIQWKHGLP